MDEPTYEEGMALFGLDLQDLKGWGGPLAQLWDSLARAWGEHENPRLVVVMGNDLDDNAVLQVEFNFPLDLGAVRRPQPQLTVVEGQED